MTLWIGNGAVLKSSSQWHIYIDFFFFFLMSFCKIVPAVLGLPATIERQVSSASELILDWIYLTISLM